MESIGAAMPGVGYLLGGAIVALADPRAAYAVAGVGVLLLVVAALPLRSRMDGAGRATARTSRPALTAPAPDPWLPRGRRGPGRSRPRTALGPRTGPARKLSLRNLADGPALA